MTARGQRVLSEVPLNAEPAPAKLVEHFFTPSEATYHRNHGEWLELSPNYTLAISSEVDGVDIPVTNLTAEDVRRFPKEEVVAVLACAGNRRQEMSAEKTTEGLQWGKSALCNTHFAGALLRDVLASAGASLEELEAQGRAEKLHVHFESSQRCEDNSYYGASLPVRMAFDPERPVLLAYEMNHEPLAKPHGYPLRLVVPGVIGARSVKWLERIIIRDKESDCFYQQRDYKILPPEATPETKEDHLKRLPALMEFPLNAEICDPEENAVLSTSEKIDVKGYAVGAKGVPIASVHIALLPLPVPHQVSPFVATTPELADCDMHQIRLHAAALPAEAWTTAAIVAGPAANHEDISQTKYWGWTLFSASVPVPEELQQRAKTSAIDAALVAYATDA